MEVKIEPELLAINDITDRVNRPDRLERFECKKKGADQHAIDHSVCTIVQAVVASPSQAQTPTPYPPGPRINLSPS